MGRSAQVGTGRVGFGLLGGDARRCLAAGAALSLALAGSLGAPQLAGAAEQGPSPEAQPAPAAELWSPVSPATDAGDGLLPGDGPAPAAPDAPADATDPEPDAPTLDGGATDADRAPDAPEDAAGGGAAAPEEPLPDVSEIPDAGAPAEGNGAEAADAATPGAEAPDTSASDGAAQAQDVPGADQPAQVAQEVQEEDTPASSWRFQDGQLVRLPDAYEAPSAGAVMPQLLSRAYYAPWSKVGDGYLSTNGSYIPGAVLRGVDVSVWDETIDWAAAKADDVDFAIIRCGYAASRGGLWTDNYWARNVSECERLGIPYGVYFYSRATTAQEAVQEATYVLGLIAGHGLSYPVYLDLEDSSIAGADLAAVARAFCDTIAAAGYQPGIYANLNWWNNLLTDPVFDSWPRWVAQYNSACHYAGDYGMWQCTASGSVAGFHTGVDINFVIDRSFTPGQGGTSRDGWREQDGRRYFYEGGRPLTGVHQIGEEWFYFDPDQGGAAYVGEFNDDEDGAWYYYDAQGVLARNEFVTLTGEYLANGPKTVYYNEFGQMVTGELEIGGSWYYFDPAQGGAMAQGRFVRLTGAYLANGAKTVYYGDDGRMVTGELQVGNDWYYLDPAKGGARATGFVRLAGAYLANGPKTVYYDASGRMVTGELQIGGAWYYFDPAQGGAMATRRFVTLTGSYLIGGPKTVYYDESGHMVYGTRVIGGRTYVFDPGSGALRG